MSKRIAAIDFGHKRIGIAISDPTCRIALPLSTVDGGKKAVEHVTKVLQNYPLSKILIGLPLLLSGKESDMALATRAFAQKLEEALQIPILFIDERLSSIAAEKSLKELSFNRKQRTSKIDMVAATLVLQQYLDSIG